MTTAATTVQRAIARALAGATLGALLAGIGATALPASASAGCLDTGFDDYDYDGVPCEQEVIYGTSSIDSDTDGDGFSDGDEIYYYGTNPLIYNGQSGRQADGDGDGLTDDDERYLVGTNPYHYDTDGDGYGDGHEYWAGSQPLNRFCNPDGCG